MNTTLDERPSVLEVHGLELLTVSAELKARGAVIGAAVTKRPGEYRLTIYWPRARQFNLPIASNPTPARFAPLRTASFDCPALVLTRPGAS